MLFECLMPKRKIPIFPFIIYYSFSYSSSFTLKSEGGFEMFLKCLMQKMKKIYQWKSKLCKLFYICSQIPVGRTDSSCFEKVKSDVCRKQLFSYELCLMEGLDRKTNLLKERLQMIWETGNLFETISLFIWLIRNHFKPNVSFHCTFLTRIKAYHCSTVWCRFLK